MSRVPVLYVRGNHDDVYASNPPGGCECIEDRVYIYKGVRFVGLGGSMRYKPGDNQYTDREMAHRVRKLHWQLMHSGGADILVTHAPAKGIGDDKDPCHTGFSSFNEFIDKYHPAYHVHGHVHINYGRQFVREMQVNNTTVINAYQHYLLEIPDIVTEDA
jgi:Icc-related predicted phosphoesterase